MISERATSLGASHIRTVAEEGMTQDDVIALWFGEGSWPSPNIGVEAAVAALRAQDHFYPPNSGKIELRDAIVSYMSVLHGRSFERGRVTVTASGMQGLALCAQILITPGDVVVSLAPAWPNIDETFRLCGADIRSVPLHERDEVWALDVDRLLDALSSNVKAVLINSPNNPTGWTMPDDDFKKLLEHCDKHGIWVVVDEVYLRLFRHGNCAPSILRHAEAEQRVITINSFSKAWSMTGWRLGWVTAPVELELRLAQLTEYNIAGAPPFIQAAGLALLEQGEPAIALLRERLHQAYDCIAANLHQMQGIRFIQPDGAFYCFFKVEGMSDSLATAQQLMRQAGVGLAPGIAFGPVGEGYLRLCYARPISELQQAMDRLSTGLGNCSFG